MLLIYWMSQDLTLTGLETFATFRAGIYKLYSTSVPRHFVDTGMGCQSTLLRASGGGLAECTGHCIDCLPHGLLIGKLRAYRLSVKACALVSSYLSNRKQTVKLRVRACAGGRSFFLVVRKFTDLINKHCRLTWNLKSPTITTGTTSNPQHTKPDGYAHK